MNRGAQSKFGVTLLTDKKSARDFWDSAKYKLEVSASLVHALLHVYRMPLPEPSAFFTALLDSSLANRPEFSLAMGTNQCLSYLGEARIRAELASIAFSQQLEPAEHQALIAERLSIRAVSAKFDQIFRDVEPVTWGACGDTQKARCMFAIIGTLVEHDLARKCLMDEILTKD